MRKLINSTYITLDGVIQDPQDWPSLGSSSERGDQIQTDLLLSCDLQIIGRKTYEAFAAAWPTRSGDPLSDRMNAMAKYVFSGNAAGRARSGCQPSSATVVRSCSRAARASSPNSCWLSAATHLAYASLNASAPSSAARLATESGTPRARSAPAIAAV
jgi:dihydrofolate reductase